MWMVAVKQLKISLIFLILMMILTGLIYPGLVTGFAQLLFPWKANGSLIERGGTIRGSALLGQAFVSPSYFWGRPSATTPYPDNPSNSSGSNMGPSNPDYYKTVQSRIDHLREEGPSNKPLIPVDLVTSSGSGLDPEISVKAALFQVERISKHRQIPIAQLENMIHQFTKKSILGWLSEPRVNVLELNMALDEMRTTHE